MTKTKKIISIAMAACLASVMTVGVFAAGETPPYDQTMVGSECVEYPDGGEWHHGTDLFNVYSNYYHAGRNHKTSCQGSWGGWGYSGPQSAGAWANSSYDVDYSGNNHAYYDFC